ncbi:MAG: hypothetical protein ABI617_04990 [Sphingomicrobium sp.]
MLAVKRLAPLLGLLVAAPAVAVGLGPLTKEGITDSDRKGFYLTVINPYATAETFTLTPLDADAEAPAPRVTTIPARLVLGGGRNRKVLVVASSLVRGERYTFRVCAERPPLPTETIHARVCSKLTARRIDRP